MDEKNAIEVKNLVKVYGKGETAVTAVNDLTFSVRQGQFVAITGESGSGKTTLLNLLGALDVPTSGSITIGGMPLVGAKDNVLSVYRRRNIGFIFQFYNLIPVLNAEENILLPMSLDNKEADREYLDELLEGLGLSDRRSHYPHQLSGGQQQRVSIGRALISRPMLVLADEPTGNLDKKNSREIVTLLKNSAKKYNQTIVLITHDEQIAAIADRIIRLEDGRIVLDTETELCGGEAE